jgi:hypothetical protein
MLGRHLAIACVAACMFASPLTAGAGVLFDNGAAIPGSGGAEMWRYLAVDDFSLSTRSSVTGGTFTFATSSGSAVTPPDLSYFVYANGLNANGYDSPAALLATGLLTVSHVEALSNPGYVPHFVATFALDNAFVAEAKTHYWFGLLKGAVTDPELRWVASDFTSPTRTWQEDHRYNPGTFQSVDYEKAFTLAGTAIPEPEAWALMILGFAGLGARLRRTKALRTA